MSCVLYKIVYNVSSFKLCHVIKYNILNENDSSNIQFAEIPKSNNNAIITNQIH